LTAGSFQRAGEIYGDILRNHPQDADAYAGLGESEFAGGNYQTAQGDFREALKLRPSDKDLEGRLLLSTEVLALDPTRRGLGVAEQYRRSAKMLELAADALARCSGTAPEPQKGAKSGATSENVEANLRLAEDLWKTRMQECKQAPAADQEALRLVMARIAQ
jgi:tetratricopeptide (TPR) repeat protein